jgi:hypothetical protein
MDTLSKDDLKTLMANEGEPQVSIFMPTHKVADLQQDPIRLKNLLEEAEERLIKGGMRSSVARDMLQPARDLLEDWAPSQSYYRSEGLAMFISSHFFRHYHVPLALEELVVVGDRFSVEPLLPLLSEAEVGSFYVLALSLKDVRLLQATHRSVREVKLPKEMPRSLAEAMRYDDFEMQHNLYSGTPGWSGGVPGAGGEAGKAGAVFFGQGVGSDVKKDNIVRYFRQVDHGLHAVLRRERAPLVLAGVGYLLPIYREANTYAQLVEDGIAGNPDDMRAEELRDQGWPIVLPLFEKAQHQAVDRYMQLVGTGQTCTEIEQIISAAYYGSVDTLFMATDAPLWGSFDPAANVAELHEVAQPGDEDLLNLAAVHTLLNHGTVYTLKPDRVPGGGAQAAVLRY